MEGEWATSEVAMSVNRQHRRAFGHLCGASTLEAHGALGHSSDGHPGEQELTLPKAEEGSGIHKNKKPRHVAVGIQRTPWPRFYYAVSYKDRPRELQEAVPHFQAEALLGWVARKQR